MTTTPTLDSIKCVGNANINATGTTDDGSPYGQAWHVTAMDSRVRWDDQEYSFSDMVAFMVTGNQPNPAPAPPPPPIVAASEDLRPVPSMAVAVQPSDVPAVPATPTL